MSNANTLELGMLALINSERAAAGLDPLRPITLLNNAAEVHSQWLLDADQFSHQGENGSTPSDRMGDAGYPFEGDSLALENIGWQSVRGEEGFEDDVAQVHAGLMNSPGHRANILNPDAEDIGIGIETGTFSGANGDYEAIMVTQVFGTTDADLSSWVDPGTGEMDDEVIEKEMENDDDQVAEDDTDVPEDEPPVDTPNIPDPVVPDDTDIPADPVDEGAPEGAPAGDDDEPSTEDEPEIVMNENIPMPCELTEFTVDLSDAFEFKREGDQLVWETSEEKLVETFLKAFEGWTEVPETEEAEDIDISDLMVDGMEDAQPEMYSCGAEVDDVDEWMSQSCV